MWPLLIVKIDPDLRRSQKLPQRVIGAAISDSQLEDADKAFRVAIVRRRASPAHGEHKAFVQEELARLASTVLLALITMPDAARYLKRHRLDRAGDQVSPHVVVESNRQHLAGAMTQRKTAPDPRAIDELDLQNIGEDDFLLYLLEGVLLQLIRRNLGGFARIDILLPFAPGGDAVFVHHPPDAILPGS
jgi:hypothetical protein